MHFPLCQLYPGTFSPSPSLSFYNNKIRALSVESLYALFIALPRLPAFTSQHKELLPLLSQGTISTILGLCPTRFAGSFCQRAHEFGGCCWRTGGFAGHGLLLAAVEHLAGARWARGSVTKAWHANLASTWWLNEENRSVFPESFTG